MLVDVHHHFNAPGGRSGRADWSPQIAIDAMDRAGVTAAVAWPGPVVADCREATAARARFLNDFGAQIVRTYPTRFGLFATMPPLHDVDAVLREIGRAYDELNADGIGLVTHYGDAWLGDAAFVPVFEELDRRGAVVFVHPTALGEDCACGALGYQTGLVSQAWLEYPFNTARTILSLMVAGTFTRFPNIRFIFCHGGGAFTALLSRITGFSGWFEIGQEKLDAMFPQGIEAQFRQLFFECAQAFAPQNMALLRSQVPDSQILFGTDFDRFPLSHSVEQFARLDLSAESRQAIASGNARGLFSRLLRHEAI